MTISTSISLPPAPVYVPFLDRAKFAAAVGVSADVVDGWIRRGYVATVTIGRRSLVDLRPWMREDRP